MLGYRLLTSCAKMSARRASLARSVRAGAGAHPGRRPRHAEEGQPSADDALAASIVQKADQIRFPAEGFEVGVTINTTTPGGPADARKYRVLSKGNENTVVMTTEPASERGQIMLMKGRDLWIFLPAVSQPVRLPLAQRLTGVVANGDLARANFAGDYKPRLLRTEKIDGEADVRPRAHRRRSQRHLPSGAVLGPAVEPLAAQGRVLLAVRPPAEDVPVTRSSSGWPVASARRG